MPALITPQININGSSAADLIEPRQQAWRLLDEVVEMLQQVTPNGRDYPGDNDHCVVDRTTHYARIKYLRELQTILLTEALHIKDQEA